VGAVRRDGDRIRLSGALRTPDAAAIWRTLRGLAHDVRPGARIEIDLSAVPAVDGGVMALLIELRSEIAARGAHAELTNMREPVAKLAKLHDVGLAAPRRMRRPPESPLARVGAATLEYVGHLKDALGFVGSLVLAAGGRGRRPAAQYREIVFLVQKTGAEAMPIVFAVLFVVGFIFAYATADTFIELGDTLLSPSLISKSMAREIAPVMTAFILSGRSGAGFAAEIGAMKINQEIDALRTLGLEPNAWLVFPRAIALVIAMPALVVAGDFFGIAGGALVGVTRLGLTLPTYVHAVQSAVSAWDVESGVLMSVAFGLAIALIACQKGFAASGGPEDVGRHTTSAVVSCLFFTVVIDAIFTVIYQSFGV
jgi:phospholipid/cholesterol/gamma-HCH transport system permease protein